MHQKHIWTRLQQILKKNIIDLDYNTKKNLDNLAQYKNKNIEDLTVCILIDLDIKK